MAKETIYRQEQEIIKQADLILQDQQFQDNGLIEEYRELAESYKKLFKTFNRIVTINDKQQNQLFKVNEELTQLNATKDKFFSIISHDLKSPINSFLNVSSLLIDHIDRFSREEIQEMAVSVKSSGSNLLKLLENLLHWSRLQMSHIDFSPRMYTIQTIFDSVMSVVSYQAKEKEIEVVSILDRDTTVYIDPNMISSVLQNLVANAIKFTYQGGQITVSQKYVGDFVEISVADNGMGISQRNLEKLFRIDIIYTGIGTNSEKGTGLGLILCKEMVERHGGQIWVESEMGKGSVFTFTCPVSEQALTGS